MAKKVWRTWEMYGNGVRLTRLSTGEMEMTGGGYRGVIRISAGGARRLFQKLQSDYRD